MNHISRPCDLQLEAERSLGEPLHNQHVTEPLYVKYDKQGAEIQSYELESFDPIDPEISYLARVVFAPDRIEQLSVVIRKGEATKEIRLI